MQAAATEGDEANVVTDYILKVLGLDICADTLVGDDMLRGISGGQKKRVTTGKLTETDELLRIVEKLKLLWYGFFLQGRCW